MSTDTDLPSSLYSKFEKMGIDSSIDSLAYSMRLKKRKRNRTTSKSPADNPNKRVKISSITKKIDSSKKSPLKPSAKSSHKNFAQLKRELAKKSFRPSKFLQKMCMDSGYCMAFGREKDRIRNFFDDMDFNHVSGMVPRIGEPSANGVVHMFKYTKDTYSTYAIMKSAQSAVADILLYEFIVGKYFINDYVSKYPCFMETYGLYEYNYTNTRKLHEIRGQMKEQQLSSAFFIQNTSKLNPDRISNTLQDEMRKICDDSKHKIGVYGTKYAILIEYVKDPISLKQYISNYVINGGNGLMFVRELVNILLQVYIPLGKLMNSFTHNDLHTGNVLLYKVPDDKYIEMRYQVEGVADPVIIHTQYIAKIIDYGRCFFKPDKSHEFNESLRSHDKYIMGSEGITELLYKTMHQLNINTRVDRCDGFEFFKKYVSPQYAYTSSAVGNISRDTGLIVAIHQFLSQNLVPITTRDSQVKVLLENYIKYMHKTLDLARLGGYGGLPRKTSECEPRLACNVELVRDSIIHFYVAIGLAGVNSTDSTDHRLGVMHIYDDGRDMLFVKE